MPIYDYKCEKGKVFEYQQSMHDEKLEKCILHDNCKATRLISRVEIRVNGPGTMTDKHLYKELEID